MRECGCWASVLTSHHSTEVESNLVNVLLAITALLFACHLPLPVAAYVFTCPDPNLPSWLLEMDLLNQQNK